MLLAVTIPAVAEFEEIQSRMTEFTLTNGMKFIVLERHQAPVVSCLIYAQVGSVDEPKGMSGLSHFIEHLAFKGTLTQGTTDYAQERLALAKEDRAFLALREERWKGSEVDAPKLKQLEEEFKAAQKEASRFVVPNGFFDPIRRAGGRWFSAAAGADNTAYYCSFPSNAIEVWFCVESDRFLSPVFRQFYQEREVIIEERRTMVENSPRGKLWDAFYAIAFRAHPYGTPILGHLSDLQDLSRPEAAAFFKIHYVPSNLIAVMVGDVVPQRAQQLAQAYFGRMPCAPKPEPLRTVEPPPDGERRVVLRLPAQRTIYVGYRRPGAGHPDDAVYEIICALLAEGSSSRLQRRLITETKVATDVRIVAKAPGHKYPRPLVFCVRTAPDHSNEEVEAVLEAELRRLQDEPVEQEELMGTKRRKHAGLMGELGNNFQAAGALAFAQGLTGDWRNFFRRFERLEAVTSEDIQRVARQTFDPKLRAVGVIEPVGPAKTK